ncbi:murein L,D-transpeptidase [Photobacterium swingsii]|uniref:L,D-transpeptidase family protein n=2 Tax=Photobacterium swingsii TaxID=680026 RepID=UPI0035534A4B
MAMRKQCSLSVALVLALSGQPWANADGNTVPIISPQGLDSQDSVTQSTKPVTSLVSQQTSSRVIHSASTLTSTPPSSTSIESPQVPGAVSIKSTPLEMQKAKSWVSEVSRNVRDLQYVDKLAQIYYAVGYTPLWQDSFVANEFEDQIRILALAGIEPEFARRYAMLQHFKQGNDWRQYDLLATDTLLSYMSYVESLPKYGKQWLFGSGLAMPLPLPSEAAIARILSAVETNRLRYFITSLKPLDESYTRMVLAINELQQLESTTWPTFYQRGIIRIGAPLKQPEALITVLHQLGDLTDYQAESLRASNIRHYNIDLVQGVKSFQQRHGLKVDGVIGPKTRYWLALSPKQRVRVLALNTQRVRLWPMNSPSVLIVNIPGYEMNLWLDNKHVMDSRVIVGRPDRRTPLMSSSINSVVFNPYWNVPISIMQKDILPKAKYDSSYITRKNFAVIRSWTSSEQIPVSAIDWRNVSVKSFPYRLRQKPGARNALGRYKFNIPNKNAIYLHDTPAKSLFSEDGRAFSSGCVRVEHADDLAMVLLNYSGVSEQRVNTLSSRSSTKTVGLKHKVQVHLIYQTAWVDDEGLVNFRDDVYLYDKMSYASQTEQKLTTVYKE